MTRERLIDRLVVGGLLVGFAGLLFYLRPHGLILNDEGWYLEPALRMLEGGVLYRDVFTYYAPLRYHLLEAVFAIGGPSILLARSVWVILILLSVAGIYRVARRLAPPSVAWLPAAAYGLAPGPWHKSPYGLCTVAYLLALARAFESRTNTRLLVLGVAAGVTLLTRQELGIAQLLMSCALLGLLPALEARSLRVETLRSGARDALLTVAGFAMTVAPVVVYYASVGALDALVDAVFLQAYEYSSQPPMAFVRLLQPDSIGQALEGRAVGGTLLASLLAYPVALGLLWREIRAERFGVSTLLGVALLIHSIPALVQGYNPPLLVRFLQSAIPFYLLVAWILGRLAQPSRSLALGAATVALAGLVSGVFGGFPIVLPSDAYTGSVRMHRYSVPVEVLGDTVLTDLQTAEEIRLARAFFAEHTRPGDPIFAAPLHSLYYTLLERRNPTRFLGDIGNRAMSPPRKRLEVQRLLVSKARYALVDRSWWSTPADPSKPILSALAGRFRPVREYQSIVILEREPDATRRRIGEIHRRMIRQKTRPADEAALRNTIRREPTEPLPRELLAALLQRSGRLDEAIELLRQASRLDPANSRLLREAEARRAQMGAKGPGRPSFVLFVSDTTRVDAVSAYGAAAGTTPTIDRLARNGLLYRRAEAQAPWTLPSHATLFTGLLPSQHGVTWNRTWAPDSLVTLAERLREAGYDTFGVSENVWVTPTFNLAQGFDGFARTAGGARDSIRAVERWWSKRSRDRPFFLFMNVIDAHWPYATSEVRQGQRFVPSGTDPETARRLDAEVESYICSDAIPEEPLAILRGLYHGGVADADAKLAEVLALLAEDRAGETIVVVTSDHGEHFGERGLISHQFSLAESLLHVPLVVHGLAGVSPATIEEPVQLADIAPSILEWAGLEPSEEVAGRRLPTVHRAHWPERASIAEYQDPTSAAADNDTPATRQMRARGEALRARCSPEWPVFGAMRSVLRYPFKLRWFERYPTELYDLSQDPEERRNLARARPELAAELLEQLPPIVSVETRPSREPTPELSDGVRDQLRALGYLEDD